MFHSIHAQESENELTATNILLSFFTESVRDVALFAFSSKGNKFGVGNAKYMKIISIPDHQAETYEGGDQFYVSEDENFVAIVMRNRVKVYSDVKLTREFKTDFVYLRKIRVSSKYNFLAIIDKNKLNVYSLKDGNLLFQDTVKINIHFVISF